MSIKISVGLPIWKSSKIAWLAFEGLIRQKVDVEWDSRRTRGTIRGGQGKEVHR
jgi:hypothetical protein